MSMMYGWDPTTAGWLWMAAGWLLLVAAIVVGAWLIARSNDGPRSSRTTPLDTLRERFARGEITKDEYEAARRALE
jgi:putative membrane protein